MTDPDQTGESQTGGGQGAGGLWRPGTLGAPRMPDGRFGMTEAIAAALTVLWLAVAAGFFWAMGGTAGGVAVTGFVLLAIVLPVALIWITAATLRTIRALRDEAGRLQATVDAMRQAYLSQPQPAPARAEGAGATFASRRDGAAGQAGRKPQSGPEEQPALALGGVNETEADPVTAAEFIRALNFPDSPEDRQGVHALRRALGDRAMAKLIRAAQDVLTLLSQDGIFMDDLVPDRAHPDLWRRFAAGERGRAIAALGGVRDRSSLTLTAGRMRQDTIFRDAAHHFLRQFDRSFAAFEKAASDAEIVAFTDTRTARAFMLLGRVSGTFD